MHLAKRDRTTKYLDPLLFLSVSLTVLGYLLEGGGPSVVGGIILTFCETGVYVSLRMCTETQLVTVNTHGIRHILLTKSLFVHLFSR